MIRRLLIAAVLTASTAVAASAFPVTFVMRNGDRISGDLTYKGGADYTLNGRDIPAWDVAIIEFVRNDPPASELSRVPNVDNNPTELERHVFVTRDGNMRLGKLYKFSPDGSVITFDQREGGRIDINANDMARVYINPGAARAVFGSALAQSSALSPTGTSGSEVRVPANTWSDTGFTVRRGETLHFNARGEVMWTPDEADRATASGARSRRSPGVAPVPNAPGGALIGRIDNGRPFLIGGAESVRMPANGRLFLSVNDDALNDNGGDFFVTISR
jgi:hypothetical protein